MEQKLRLAIDMDEVMADTIDKFMAVYRRDHNVELPLEEMNGKEFHELLPDTLNGSWRNYVNAPGFFRDIKVMPDSQEIVKELYAKYDLYVVSAAMEFRNSLIDKLDWLNEHFPFISWKNIIFCGNKIVDVQIMIDDRIRNFANFGGRKILFTSPHNYYITEYERANTWQEVADKLL
jgi:5'(3')-deoxyribonucleotidase